MSLSSRPDVRHSQPFRTFIDFDSHTNFAIVPHELGRGRLSIDQRFGVVGLAHFGDALVGVHTDTTSLSRLGKVWSIVEPDELAQLTIWRIQRNQSSFLESNDIIPLGEKLYSKLLPEKGNCMRVNSKGELFLGMGDGLIACYKLEDPSIPFMTINAHGQSPVIAIEILNDDTVVSVGLDGGLRVSSCRNGKVMGGGKLSKRLEPNEIFRCLALHPDSGRAFIGTDRGRVFVYDILSSDNPQYLHSLVMASYPVRTIHVSQSSLIVGFASMINVYPLCAKGNERGMTRDYQIQTTNSVGVHSCTTLPGTAIVAAGLSDGSVAFYSKSSIVYSRYFSEDKINVIYFSPQDRVLWAGGDDGRIVEVKVPQTLTDDVQYVDQFDSNTSENTRPTVSHVPSSDGSSNKFANHTSPALAEDDSDDEWRKGLFSN